MTHSSDPMIVSVYTNAQAIEDGIKMDVTEQAKGYGFPMPVFLTTNLFTSHIEVKDKRSGQSTEGRMHDLLFLAINAARRANPNESMTTFKGKFGKYNVEVWACLDGDGLTLLLPEDY